LSIWIRIQTKSESKPNPDPNPEPDPDWIGIEKKDWILIQMNPDPQPWREVSYISFRFLVLFSSVAFMELGYY
jgi:hypothetical protein